MKKNYKSLEIEVIMFEKKDVVTASGAENQPVEQDNSFFSFRSFW